MNETELVGEDDALCAEMLSQLSTGEEGETAEAQVSRAAALEDIAKLITRKGPGSGGGTRGPFPFAKRWVAAQIYCETGESYERTIKSLISAFIYFFESDPSVFRPGLRFRDIIPSSSALEAWVPQMGMVVKLRNRNRIRMAIENWKCCSISTDASTQLASTGKALQSVELSIIEIDPDTQLPCPVKIPISTREIIKGDATSLATLDLAIMNDNGATGEHLTMGGGDSCNGAIKEFLELRRLIAQTYPHVAKTLRRLPCDIHALQNVQNSSFEAGFGEEAKLTHGQGSQVKGIPNPYSMAYSVYYSACNKNWGDIQLAITNIGRTLKDDPNWKFKKLQKAMKGKWKTLHHNFKQQLEDREVLLKACHLFSNLPSRGGLEGQSAAHRREWKRNVNWLSRPGSHLSMEWTLGFTAYITHEQDRSQGPNGLSKRAGFRTLEMPGEVLERMRYFQELADDPVAMYPKAKGLYDAETDKSVLDEAIQKITATTQEAVYECNYWYQDYMVFPDCFWLVTENEIGLLFLYRCLQCVLPQAEHSIKLPPSAPTQFKAASEARVEDITDEGVAKVNNLFSPAWHKSRLDNLQKMKKKGKVRKAQRKAYDPAAGAKSFFEQYVCPELLEECISMVQAEPKCFDLHDPAFPHRLRFLLRYAVVGSHENTSAERQMSKILIHGNKHLKLSTQELKLLVLAVLEEQRKRRRMLRMQEGLKKVGGEALRKDMENSDQHDMFGQQLLDWVHHLSDKECLEAIKSVDVFEKQVRDMADYVRKEQMPHTTEHVVQEILAHCEDGTTVFPNGNADDHEGHQCGGAAHKRVYLIAWQSYNEQAHPSLEAGDQTWETFASLLQWAAWRRHVELVERYCTANGLEMEEPEVRKAVSIESHCDGGCDHHPEHCDDEGAPPHERKYLVDFPDISDGGYLEFMTRSELRQYKDREWHNKLCDAYDKEHPIVLPEESEEEDESDGTDGTGSEEEGTASGSSSGSD